MLLINDQFYDIWDIIQRFNPESKTTGTFLDIYQSYNIPNSLNQ